MISCPSAAPVSADATTGGRTLRQAAAALHPRGRRGLARRTWQTLRTALTTERSAVLLARCLLSVGRIAPTSRADSAPPPCGNSPQTPRAPVVIRFVAAPMPHTCRVQHCQNVCPSVNHRPCNQAAASSGQAACARSCRMTDNVDRLPQPPLWGRQGRRIRIRRRQAAGSPRRLLQEPRQTQSRNEGIGARWLRPSVPPCSACCLLCPCVDRDDKFCYNQNIYHMHSGGVNSYEEAWFYFD
jgi:hypothetical protein